MKISKKVLDKIVNEEYSKATSRRSREVSALKESKGKFDPKPYHLRNVETGDLLEFANRWAKVGSFVQENVQQLLSGDFSDIDPGSIDEAKQFIGFHPELDEAILEYEKYVNGDE